MRSITIPALIAGLLLSPPLAAGQDIAEIFSNESFYEEHDLLRGRGEVPFVADVWTLPSRSDSTRLLLGVSLSNDALQFVRTEAGTWRASYSVQAVVENGDPVLDRTWEKSVDVRSFDETTLTGETIVFQTDLPLPAGEYELTVTVRDRNADRRSRARREIEVPDFGAMAMSEPVPLKLVRGEGADADYVVHPSHFYATAPSTIDFLSVLSAAPGSGPYRLSARLVPKREGRDRSIPEWSSEVTPDSVGMVRAFGTLENDEPRFGEYGLEVRLADAAGSEVASVETPLLIAGSSGWIIDNWDDALKLVQYEATRKELEILEDVEDPRKRIEAWNCFWAIRDPAPSTATNEAMQEYFQRLQIANERWTSALRKGFLSDRGRVYVTIGAPDDIQQRPMPRDGKPLEVWRYYSRGGNFQIVFVDRIGFNNYQLWDRSVPVYQSELSLIERRKREFLARRADECPLLAPAFE
ncbi:MAG: GWxTD domain-containing protein [Gemmatimonadota bacterium]|nr:GWxTD domain-containing protein [Gemmatimonadota bacterium]